MSALWWLVAALLAVEIVCAARKRVDAACGLGILADVLAFFGGASGWIRVTPLISIALIALIWRYSWRRRARQLRQLREWEML